MLIRFICENFKSFKKKTVFSMIAGKMTRFPEHVTLKNKKRILRGAYIFGANAAGKSNFIKAIDFARRIILNSLEHVDCNRMYFLLDSKQKENHVGLFQFDIAVEGTFYSYGFAVNYQTIAIEGEWLFENDGTANEKCLFSRSQDENGQTVIESVLKLPKEEQNRFNVYKADFASVGMRKTLFLCDVAKRSTGTPSFSDSFLKVLTWFSRLLVVFPESHFTGIPSFSVNEAERKTYSEWLKHFDTGIESLEDRDIPEDKFWDIVPQEIREKIKSDILSKYSVPQEQNVVVSLYDDNGTSYFLSRHNGVISIKKVLANHGRQDVLFERYEESDGTRRLFDLLPLLQMQKDGRVIVIDELDRSLHTKATFEFLRLFYEMSDNSQMIVTTHDDDILDLDTIRQDEIWFVERGKDKSSGMYSLSKYKARFDKDVRKSYLLGRYGALPIFNNQIKKVDIL